MSDDPTLLGLDAATAAVVSVLKTNVKLSQTLGACGFAVCLWDNLAYVHQEYRLVWQSKFSPLKATYLFTRYISLISGVMYFVGFFASFTQSSCNAYVKAMPAVGTLPILGASLVLLIRAYSLQNKNAAVLLLMLFLAVAQTAIAISVGISQTHSIPLFPGYVDACVPTASSNVYVLYWIFPAVIHAFLLVLTSVSAWRALSDKPTPMSPAEKIWAIVVSRYGQIFPILMITIECFQIAFYLSVDGTLKAISAPLSGFLVSVLACQMVLTMRLTTKAGLAGTSFASSEGSNSNMHAVGVAGPQVAKLTRPGGIQAFVTSHHAVDKEELEFDGSAHTTHANGRIPEFSMPRGRDAASRRSGIVASTEKIDLPDFGRKEFEDEEVATTEKDKDSFVGSISDRVPTREDNQRGDEIVRLPRGW